MSLPSRRLVPNPDWATKILTNFYGPIVDDLRLPFEMLPRITDLRPVPEGDGTDIQARMEEYGCGAYGCVYPTNDPNIVLKLTADDTEATFADEWASTLVRPICVYYYKVVRPRGAKDNKGSPVWMLWRESAAGIGHLDEYASEEAKKLLNHQHKYANAVYRAWHDNQKGISNKIDLWQLSCEAMYSVPDLTPLAQGMVTVFHEQGIFFGDVHSNNVGLARRGESGTHDTWVITDPGHIAIVR